MTILTPAKRALLRDVVKIIVDDGYAEPLPPPKKKRPHIKRIKQIEVLALDPRILHSKYDSWIIDYVVSTYNVNRNVASNMLYQARRTAKERE